MAGYLGIETTFGPAGQQPRALDGEAPMRILVMAELSGGSGRERLAADIADRPTMALDIDRLAEVLARARPRASVRFGDESAPPLELEFAELDDFHPDTLYQRLPLFRQLRELRRRLADPATFAAAAGELKAWAAAEDTSREHVTGVGDGDTLARLLGEPPARGSGRQSEMQGTVARLVRSIVAPHVVPDVEPEQRMLIGSIDDAISEKMRALLHDPAFQAVEAIWRGLEWLVTELELGEKLQLAVVDIGKRDLALDLASKTDGGGMHRLLAQKPPELGANPWSVVIGCFDFDDSEEDVATLCAVCEVAAHTRTPFLADAAPAIFGCASIGELSEPRSWIERGNDAVERWQSLRAAPKASWVGLAVPRLLIRQPYGARDNPVESFDFEELPAQPKHEHLLWTNAALGCALLLGNAFDARGWSMSPDDERDIGDLPAFVYSGEDGKELMPVAETWLTERAAETILGFGVMVLVSIRNANTARLLRFQSLADPAQALAGPWC